MKKIYSIMVAALLAAATLIGCSTEEEVSIFAGIYGVITDADTNQPIQGASVVLSPTNMSTVTGADGSYSFSDLDAQQYKITVTASGYEYNSRQVTAVTGQNISCDMNLTPEVAISGFSLSSTSLVFGNIYSEMTFTITNTGNSSATTWSITDIDDSWLTVSPTSGTTEVGKSSSVKVTINRTLVTEDVVSYFIVNAGGGSEQIMVTASKADSGSGEESTVTNSISINKTALAFGETYNSLSFVITNSGVEDIDFTLYGNYTWINGADPASGTVSALSTKTVTIYINRDNIYGSVEGLLTVSTDEGDYYLDMTAYEPIDYGTVESPYTTLSVEVSDVYMTGSTTLYIDYKATYTGTITTDYFNISSLVSGVTSISDDEGNVYDYKSASFSLGGGSYSSSPYVYSTMSNSVIKGSIQITNVDVNATKFNISLYTNLRVNSTNNYGSIVFTNVPIIR